MVKDTKAQPKQNITMIQNWSGSSLASHIYVAPKWVIILALFYNPVTLSFLYKRKCSDICQSRHVTICEVLQASESLQKFNEI